MWLTDSRRAFADAITNHAVPGHARNARRNIELGEKHGARTNEGVVVGRRSGVLCTVSAAGAQTTSLDREVKAAAGREMRVGIYTSMRADCTGGPLPAIRLSVAPEHGPLPCVARHSKRPMSSSALGELPVLVAFYRPKGDSANNDRFELEVSFADGRKQIQRFHVTISNGANEGQRI